MYRFPSFILNKLFQKFGHLLNVCLNALYRIILFFSKIMRRTLPFETITNFEVKLGSAIATVKSMPRVN